MMNIWSSWTGLIRVNSPLWNQEGTRLAFYNREGIWITKPGEDPQLYLLCEGVTKLLRWQGIEIVFTLRDGDTFAVIRTDGEKKNILAQPVHLNR
ncbi:MAG: hypothetical protein WCY82_08695 [Desulfotomaculaceae bacterium]